MSDGVDRTDVPTERASAYLQQLCKHWSHRFDVEYDPSHGCVTFPSTTCTFVAEPGRLVVTLTGDDAAERARLRGVVAEHLQRFATKERLAFDWRGDLAQTTV